MKRIDTKKLAHLNDIVGKEKAMEIHLEIMQAILCGYSVQPYKENGGLAIQVSQETAQILGESEGIE